MCDRPRTSGDGHPGMLWPRVSGRCQPQILITLRTSLKSVTNERGLFAITGTVQRGNGAQGGTSTTRHEDPITLRLNQ